MVVIVILAFFLERGLLGRFVREEQEVRYVLAARAGGGDLLEGKVSPVQQVEHFLDDLAFGIGFVMFAVCRKGGVNASQAIGEGVQRIV